MTTQKQNDRMSLALLAGGCAGLLVAVYGIVWECSALIKLRELHSNKGDVTAIAATHPVVRLAPMNELKPK